MPSRGLRQRRPPGVRCRSADRRPSRRRAVVITATAPAPTQTSGRRRSSMSTIAAGTSSATPIAPATGTVPSAAATAKTITASAPPPSTSGRTVPSASIDQRVVVDRTSARSGISGTPNPVSSSPTTSPPTSCGHHSPRFGPKPTDRSRMPTQWAPSRPKRNGERSPPPCDEPSVAIRSVRSSLGAVRGAMSERSSAIRPVDRCRYLVGSLIAGRGPEVAMSEVSLSGRFAHRRAGATTWGTATRGRGPGRSTRGAS